MPRDRLVLIQDALEAATDVIEFLRGKSLEEFVGNKVLKAAVERKIEIVGEALNVARKIDPHLEEAITSLPQIVRTRNFLSHAYHSVVHPRLYEIAEKDLPLLIRELETILSSDPIAVEEPL